MLYVVLAFWILVAGGVFLLALSGGPAGIGNQLHAGSTLAKRTRLLGLVVVVAFGIAVPIAVATANGQRPSDSAVKRNAALASLSRDHHRALFVARTRRRGGRERLLERRS